MKTACKKFAKLFFILTRRNPSFIRSRLLFIDSKALSAQYLVRMIQDVREMFCNAHVTVMVYHDKRDGIEGRIPEAEIIVMPRGVGMYGAIIRQLKYPFACVVVSSLENATVGTVLLFCRGPVYLYNRWLQWYTVRYRTVADAVFSRKSVDSASRSRLFPARFSPGAVLRSLGRLFIILDTFQKEAVTTAALVVDNGYTDIGHVSTAVRRAREILLNPAITVVTFAARRHYFAHMFPESTLVLADEKRRYAVAAAMCGLWRRRFSVVILTTLDSTPIIAAFLVLRRKVLLYNKWHEWWTLEWNDCRRYAWRLVKSLFGIPLLLWLVIQAGVILVRTALRKVFVVHSGYEDGYDPVKEADYGR